MTPFSHLPGDILSGLDKARSFAKTCDGPISVVIKVPRHIVGNGRSVLPAYRIGRTFWSSTYEESIRLWSLKK